MPIVADLSPAVVSAVVASRSKATDTPEEASLAALDTPAETISEPTLRSKLTAASQMDRLSALFAALADTTRLRILEALAQHELCVGALSAALDLTQSATSHQLRILRDLRLVKRRRAGRLVYYSLDNGCVPHLLSQGLEHLREQGTT